ncbi:SH3 domain-containing protein [Nitrosomonas sp. GH22]|nr:SH3 domain-containing protein [Nitrosomonas sp. GH22]
MPRFCQSQDKQLLTVLILISVGSGMGGCASYLQQKPLVSRQSINLKSANAEKTEKMEIIPIPEKLPCHRLYQEEIVVLKQMLEERDELIRKLNARELDQVQALQETASEISRAKHKLHRLATQPETASKIAEVEVAMAALKQTRQSEADIAFQSLAQRSLDAAMEAYRQKDYSNAMNHAAQSGEFIDAISNSARRNLESQDAVLSFHAPILLLVTQDSSLRTDPDSHSKVISLLKKNTHLTATSYHGNWLHVQTKDNLSGWIQSLSVDIQINDQNFEK